MMCGRPSSRTARGGWGQPGPLWQPGSLGYSPLSPCINPALVKQLGDVDDHYHIRWQAPNLQHLQYLWHMMKHCQRMVNELYRMERICIQLRFRRHVSTGHQRTSWHSSRVQQNPASEEHTLTSPRPCTSNAWLNRQMVWLLQTILIRVEHQGTQLDAISARLSDGGLELQEDLEGPFSNIQDFETFDQDLSENNVMRLKLSPSLSEDRAV
ncbi:uncharacterized protein LOC115311408 isoform X3 [Ixodes scapularis]|uniref:uncharacterized protein LOC115311408 isoform X3 n=1 Tax=Ixodes scapularis TaxID=6945 RepID=UPI001C387F4C|nr:uncharacterized protein LOC115311408 isoform X3 [Ixodes scapularis]